MKHIGLASALLIALLLQFVWAGDAQAQTAASDLAGTSWQLVKFEGSDASTLTPEDGMKYTITFGSDGSVSVRIDCNRGEGRWKSSGPNQLEFGPLALTRAMCPPGPLNDRLPRDWQYLRSYILRDGQLFVSLMADASIYEFKPATREEQAAGRVKGTATYRERMALPDSALFEAVLEDVSRADAAAEVIARTRIEHPGNPPIRFEIMYEPTKIEQNHDYSVRARITDGERLVFTTVQNYPVLTRGNGNEVNLLLSLAAVPSAASSAPSESSLSVLPATFVGMLPCADCPGIRYQLNLFPDHTFVSRMTYEDRNHSLDHHGHWQLTGEGKMLVLQGEGQAQEKFAVRDVDTLRKLDVEGHAIESKLNYDVKRAAEFEPIEPRPLTMALLENTYWKLTSLGEVPVTAVSQQEPHFVLNPETHRVSGSGGCNRLTGSYELKGDHLTFSQLATTMMACVEGMDTEKALLKALTKAKTWKMAGDELELLNDAGNVMARFEARGMTKYSNAPISHYIFVTLPVHATKVRGKELIV
jgi:copper homeostasis protein (lipoprotein)